MRNLICIALLSLGAYATPLTVKPEAKARSFTIDVGDGWLPGDSPNTLKKREEKDPENVFPESVGASSTYERDAGQLVAMTQKLFPGKFQVIKLGGLDALLKRDTRGFAIHAGAGSTKIDITYYDGRSGLDLARMDAVLNQIKASFRWTK